MLKIRRDQLDALGNDRTRRARQKLAEQLTASGLEAAYDRLAQRLDVRDAARGSVQLNFGDSRIRATTGEARTFEFTYDERGRPQSLTDPAGFLTTFERDDRGNLVAIHRGGHSTYGFEVDDENNVVGIRAPDRTETRFSHDSSGRVVSVTGADQSVATFEYTPGGLPRRVVDPAGSVMSYAYGADGELESVVRADGSQIRVGLEPETGSLAIDRDGRPIASITADLDARAAEFSYADGSRTRLVWAKGRIVEAENETGKIKVEYNEQGQVLSEDTDGRVVRFVRDAIGALIAIVTPDGERIAFERDTEHRVRRVLDWSGASYEVSYELSGALAGVSYPNGAEISRISTEVGLPKRLTLRTPAHRDAPVLDVNWTYDVCDRVISEFDGNNTRRYAYNECGRLVATETSGRAGDTFELDAVGNRVTDGTQDCGFNALHQLFRRGDATYRYDAHGNMVDGASPTGAIRCRYNGRGEMIEVQSRSGVTRYAYDSLGRRILKARDGRTTHYVWAGQQLLSEITDEPGRSTRRDYLVLPEGGIALAMRIDGVPYYLHHGRRHEPLAMSDRSGRIVWMADYSAFGEALTSISEIDQPFRLQGQYYDNETGLHYNLKRYYDPELGRFLTMDPLGIQGGSFNLYAFCDGDPLNRTDPTGELAFLAVLAIGVGIGAVVGAVAEAYRQHKEGKGFNLGDIVKEAGKGAIVGLVGTLVGMGLGAAVGAVATGVAAIAVGGAVVGGATAAVEQCVDNKLHDRPMAHDIGRAAAIGAGIGLATAGAGAIWANRARRAAQATREAEEAARRTQQALRNTIDRRALSESARAADRGGLTKAGNSLAKHAAGKRPGSSKFPPPKGNPEQINKEGQAVLDEILNDPGSVYKTRPGKGGEEILQVSKPDGTGAIYKKNDGAWEFSHFGENLY